MSALAPARRVALDVLVAATREKSYAREVLDRADAVARLDARDRGLCRRLVLGATATEGSLDELLDTYLSQPRKVSPRVRAALRIAAFEIVYLRTPTEVAVSQGVELVRSVARGAAGLANAVLRRVAEGAEGYLSALDAPLGERERISRARRAGLPVWLSDRIDASLPASVAEALRQSELEPAPVSVHVRPGAARLQGGRPSELPGCVLDADAGQIARTGAFARAEVVASDLHAQLVATAAVSPGACLEIGAGRGTKTFIMACQAARAGYKREHVAVDLYPGKCAANLERLERAGFCGVRALAGDARDLDAVLAPLGDAAGMLFDTVLVDAPCSGTGTMRRHPEIPWRLAEADIQPGGSLPTLQLSLLTAAAARVRLGGSLLYATCSVLDAENRDVIAAFLASEQGRAFRLAPVSESPIFTLEGFMGAAELVRAHEKGDGTFRTAPAPGAYDGHFCARMVRSCEL